ncbi:MAG: hypothetical protein ACKOGJ_10470, partial [Phycisphaerales bacterium]
LASTAAAATAGSAFASIPAVSVRIEQVGSGFTTINPTPNPVEGGYTYSGAISLWGFQSSFELSTNSKSGTGNEAFGGFFTLKNTTATVQQFIIDMTVTNDPFSGNALAGGSVAGVLLGGPQGGLPSSTPAPEPPASALPLHGAWVTVMSMMNCCTVAVVFFSVKNPPKASLPVAAFELVLRSKLDWKPQRLMAPEYV